jgi:nucleotide-binding universal stress UspA family protein
VCESRRGEEMYSSLLIPTDGSEQSKEAASEGLDLAEALGAEVHAFSVVDAELVAGTTHTTGAVENEERLQEEAEENAKELAEMARERGLEAVEVVEVGIPAEKIVEYAEENVDAIVMGTHGRSGVRRVLLGSVTDNVVRTASVPVVTVSP